jgi:AraC-like DNA-binding protein
VQSFNCTNIFIFFGNHRKTIIEVVYDVGYSDVKAFREVFEKNYWRVAIRIQKQIQSRGGMIHYLRS